MGDVILDRTINQFLEHGRFVRNWSPKTIRCYSQCLAVYRKANSELPTKTILTAFVVQMRQQGRSAGGCNVIIRSLNSFTSWLYEEGLIPEPLKLKLLRAERTAVTTLGDTDIKRLLVFPRKDRAWMMMVVMLDTGLRISEVLGLERQHVDLERLTLRVLGKGRKERFVPISSELRRHLWRWMRHGRQDRQDRQGTGRYVFATRAGSRLSYRNSYRDIRGICQALGIDTHPHALRHCFAVSYVRRGGDIYKLSRVLGHASVTTTSIYLRSMGVDALREGHEQLSPLTTMHHER